MQNISELRERKLEDLLEESFKIRKKNFPDTLSVSTPSPKTYISDFHKNKKNSFVNISVTGKTCSLNCEHCKKSLLDDMIPVKTGDELKAQGDRLIGKGCQGVLISGGALATGEVPLETFMDSIGYLKGLGLKVLVHTGLSSRETAVGLKKAGVDQVLLDIIGDEETIRDVYHLNKTPADFLNTLKVLKEVGLEIAPHIVIGLNFGKVKGEYDALEMVTSVDPTIIVLVVLNPIRGTPMEGIRTTSPEEVGKIISISRILNPHAHITLGCARPPGTDKLLIERNALLGGVSGIAYPSDETLQFAKELGLKPEFKDTCCSLL